MAEAVAAAPQLLENARTDADLASPHDDERSRALVAD